jgi:hypothetical protein
MNDNCQFSFTGYDLKLDSKGILDKVITYIHLTLPVNK